MLGGRAPARPRPTRAAIAVVALGVATWAAAPAVGAGPEFTTVPADYSITGLSGQTRAIAAGDLTGDARPDLTLAGTSLWALRVTGDPASPGVTLPVALTDDQLPPDDPYYDDVAVAELSGDARPDVATVGPGGVRRWVNSGPGGSETLVPSDTRLLIPAAAGGDGEWAIAAGLIDTGERTDIAVVGPLGGWVIRQTGAGSFSAQAFLSGTDLEDVALGDFSGDGRTDIAVAGDGGARVLTQSGTFSFTARPVVVPGPVASIVAGHFDGDATLDLAASRPGADEIAVRLGRGDAVATFDTVAAAQLAENPGPLATADFDRNGTADLVAGHLHVGPNPDNDVRDQATVLAGAGNGTFAASGPPIEVAAGAAPQTGNTVRSIAVADVDLDTRPDLLFADSELSAALVSRNTSTILPPGGNGPGPGNGPPGNPSFSTARRGPGLLASAAPLQRLTLRFGIRLRAGCALACRVVASGKIKIGSGRRATRVPLKRVKRLLRPGQTIPIAMKVPRRRWPTVARALARRSPVTATVVVVGTDRQGVKDATTLVFELRSRPVGRG